MHRRKVGLGGPSFLTGLNPFSVMPGFLTWLGYFSGDAASFLGYAGAGL